MRQVRRWNTAAEGVTETGIFVPVADMRCRYPIGAAEQIEKAAQPALDISDRSAAPGPFTQGQRFSAILITDRGEAICDIIQGVFPAHSLPARIGIALGSGALERMIESIGMINQLRCCLAFDADDAAIGVIVIGIESDDSAVLYGSDSGAVRRAQRAVAAYRAIAVGLFGNRDQVAHRLRLTMVEWACQLSVLYFVRAAYRIGIVFRSIPSLAAVEMKKNAASRWSSGTAPALPQT